MKYTLTVEKPNGEKSEYSLDEDEVNYVINQIKYNQPFIIAMEDDLVAYSPSQCVSISITVED